MCAAYATVNTAKTAAARSLAYVQTPQHWSALEFMPEIVFVMLGAEQNK